MNRRRKNAVTLCSVYHNSRLHSMFPLFSFFNVGRQPPPTGVERHCACKGQAADLSVPTVCATLQPWLVVDAGLVSPCLFSFQTSIVFE